MSECRRKKAMSLTIFFDLGSYIFCCVFLFFLFCWPLYVFWCWPMISSHGKKSSLMGWSSLRNMVETLHCYWIRGGVLLVTTLMCGKGDTVEIRPNLSVVWAAPRRHKTLVWFEVRSCVGQRGVEVVRCKGVLLGHQWQNACDTRFFFFLFVCRYFGISI